MNIYEAIVMTIFALVALALAICNYRAQLRSAADSRKIATLTAENEQQKAEIDRLKASKRCESLFIEFAQDAISRGQKK